MTSKKKEEGFFDKICRYFYDRFYFAFGLFCILQGFLMVILIEGLWLAMTISAATTDCMTPDQVRSLSDPVTSAILNQLPIILIAIGFLSLVHAWGLKNGRYN